MTSAQNDDEPPPLSLRAVVIGALGVAAAIAVACDPLLATPIGGCRGGEAASGDCRVRQPNGSASSTWSEARWSTGGPAGLWFPATARPASRRRTWWDRAAFHRLQSYRAAIVPP